MNGDWYGKSVDERRTGKEPPPMPDRSVAAGRFPEEPPDLPVEEDRPHPLDDAQPLESRAIREPTGRALADAEPEQVRWLWPGRVALGKVVMIDGAPDLGKFGTPTGTV